MKSISFREVFLTVCFSFLFFTSFAEGTAELTPSEASDGHGVLQIWAENDVSRNSFTYGCNANRKLRFSICNLGEVVHFGMSYDPAQFNAVSSSLWYRIISPSSAQAFPSDPNTWQQITNTGAGSISNWSEAMAGPSNIVAGAGGYIPLSFTAIETGEFYIEFYRIAGSAAPTTANAPITATTTSQIEMQEQIKTNLSYFDLTITNTVNGTRIKGRLFSKAWEINTKQNPFIAKTYVYSMDRFVTAVHFNNMQPVDGLIIFANQNGVSTTGNAFVDRKSANGISISPEYKIFLNDPDPCAHPKGQFGSLLSNMTISGNDPRELCFNIRVDNPGRVDILLNMNGIPDYQEGSADRVISANLSGGSNCIKWDSKDGNGDVVHADIIDINLIYYNGKVNLPVCNIVFHLLGFIVESVDPSSAAPKIFWDDSNISGFSPSTSISLSGCIDAFGCHSWGNASDGSVPEGNPSGNFGANTTLNTFWYANMVEIADSYLIPTVVFLNLPDESSTVTLNNSSFALSGGYPTGGTYSGPGVTNNIFSPAAAGIGTHTITYTYDFEHGGSHAAARTTHVSQYTYTATDEIIVSTTTDRIEHNKVVKGIYPNPNNGSFHIVGSIGALFTLYDATGKQIQSITISESDAWIQSTLTQGMYHYTLRDAAQNSIGGSMIVF